MPGEAFRDDCRDCARLARFLAECRANRPDYFARPVPAFGDAAPRLLIVGLAPGYHGANRTGRPFTGDHAGELLYRTLHAYGYADRPVSRAADDGLELLGCRITNAVKCVPPENKPTAAEVRACNRYLRAELLALPKRAAILALGRLAHGAVLRALGLRAKDYPFRHGTAYVLPDGRRLYASYHCSRYNTQTGRLTSEMFGAMFARIRSHEED